MTIETKQASEQTVQEPEQLAQELLNQAKQLARQPGKKKNRSQAVLIRRAIVLLEKQAPESKTLADAYIALAFTHIAYCCKPARRREHWRIALEQYEKAILVLEKQENKTALIGNLCNLSTLYYNFGDLETALARSLRALDMERALPKEELREESVASWNKAAAFHLELGQLDKAENIIREGIGVFNSMPQSAAHLWSTLGDVYAQRAKQAKDQAIKLAPGNACVIG